MGGSGGGGGDPSLCRLGKQNFRVNQEKAALPEISVQYNPDTRVPPHLSTARRPSSHWSCYPGGCGSSSLATWLDATQNQHNRQSDNDGSVAAFGAVGEGGPEEAAAAPRRALRALPASPAC
ncbi:hypothetical protein E2C01_033313 [Portunus trituberculatus]|uniref:Uncharacterized protein n=1 Tax=Portunus trituberculatus TaxID=210409 RepID=A0A5B7F579_PORTR|nr:hypothetical protein [Portunus trituberculatus]